MPYPLQEIRQRLKDTDWEEFFYHAGCNDWPCDPVDDEDKGKMNYLYTTQEIIPAWKDEARYHTIHNICKNAFNVDDQQAAKICAFFEFYRRVGSKYEDEAIKRNGDVY